VSELLQHPWFLSFPWEDLHKKRLQAPYLPSNGRNYHQSNIEEPWKDINDECFIEAEASLNQNDVQDQFTQYYYDAKLVQYSRRHDMLQH
jgi:serine/threonine kinase 32